MNIIYPKLYDYVVSCGHSLLFLATSRRQGKRVWSSLCFEWKKIAFFPTSMRLRYIFVNFSMWFRRLWQSGEVDGNFANVSQSVCRIRWFRREKKRFSKFSFWTKKQITFPWNIAYLCEPRSSHKLRYVTDIISSTYHEHKSIWTKNEKSVWIETSRYVADIASNVVDYLSPISKRKRARSSLFWIKNTFTPTSLRPKILHIYKRERLSISLRREERRYVFT